MRKWQTMGGSVIGIGILLMLIAFTPLLQAARTEPVLDTSLQMAFYEAATKGDLEKVQSLISQVDINAVNYEGDTALHLACRGNHPAVVEALIAKGAKLNLKNNFGESPLFDVIANGNANLVKLLVSKGAQCEQRNRTGRTALFQAIAMGQKSLVELLLSQGADLLALDGSGKTVLFAAVEAGSLELAGLCLAKGIDLHCPDNEGNTVLHEACASDKGELAAFLISKGADVNFRNQAGETPLFTLCKSGGENVKLAALLINKGAAVNLKDFIGMPILLNACQYGKRSMVKLLLEQGADAKQTDRQGLTAAQYALEYGWTDVTKTLAAKGVVDAKPVAKKEAVIITKVYSLIENIHSTYWADAKESDSSVLYYNFFIYIDNLKENIRRIKDVSVYDKYGLLKKYDLEQEVDWEDGCIGRNGRVYDNQLSYSQSLILNEGFRVEVVTNDGMKQTKLFALSDPGTVQAVGAQYLYAESFRGPITADFKPAFKLGWITEVQLKKDGLDVYFTMSDPRVFNGCLRLMDKDKNCLAELDYFVQYPTGKLSTALNHGKAVHGDNRPNLYQLDFSRVKLEKGHRLSDVKYLMLILTDGKQFIGKEFLGLYTNCSYSKFYPVDLSGVEQMSGVNGR